jgi:phosphopantetheine adenylyltransferase
MTGVVLFRAQPFHNGHLNTVKKAYEDCKQTNSKLYIFVGSADKVGTTRNPIPIEFRLMLIKGALHETFDLADLANISVIPLDDMTDEADNSYSWGRYLFMKMLGHTKDADMTIYYSDRPDIMLGWFDAEDRWCLRFKFLDRFENISATLVRNLILSDMPVDKFVPSFVNMHIDEVKRYLKEAK